MFDCETLLSVAVCAVLLFALAGCGETVEPVLETEPPEPEPGEEVIKTQVFEVSDRVRMGDLAITVNEVNTSAGSEWEKPGENQVYLLIDITLENVSDEPQVVSSLLQFDLVDERGYSMDHAIYTEARGKVDGEIAPGRLMSGQIAWKVPLDIRGLEMLYTASLISHGQAVFAIGDVADYTE